MSAQSAAARAGAEPNGAGPVNIAERIAGKRAEWFATPAGGKGAPRFVAKRAADALHAETPVAVCGEQLWIHDGQGYVDGAMANERMDTPAPSNNARVPRRRAPPGLTEPVCHTRAAAPCS